jgi:predicted nuclease of predicted toxin-antitoxin system
VKFLLDHDVPSEIGRMLHHAGHDVITVKDVLPVTATDEQLFDWAVGDLRVLVTCNRDDFMGIAKDRKHSGLIVLTRRRTRVRECSALIRLLTNAGNSGIADNINFA